MVSAHLSSESLAFSPPMLIDNYNNDALASVLADLGDERHEPQLCWGVDCDLDRS